MIRISITDDHPLVLDGLRAMLSTQPDMQVIGTSQTAAQTRQAAAAALPDLLLLDIQLPDGDGIELCKWLKKTYPALHIIALSNLSQPAFVRQMMKAGAAGYLLKNVPHTVLYEAIRKVMAGESYLQAELQQMLLAESLGRAQASSFIPVLTRREREILHLIVEECTTQEIADRLCITVSTVETHRLNLMQKFGVRNMAGLVREAVLKGLAG
ncbi:MAG: response regulator transcription factor [Bacteroidia bacterium]|nr:response regulator transcription factor [Bacteroidia bacterium]